MIKRLFLLVDWEIISQCHADKKQYGTFVKENEFIRPNCDEVKYLLNDTFKDCSNKFFQSFEYRCAYDNKFTNMEKNEKVILTLFIGYMKFNSQFYEKQKCFEKKLFIY